MCIRDRLLTILRALLPTGSLALVGQSAGPAGGPGQASLGQDDGVLAAAVRATVPHRLAMGFAP
eukprot:4998449-Prorocentrum_lima.AAC.1